MRREDFIKRYGNTGINESEIDKKWREYINRVNEEALFIPPSKSISALPEPTNAPDFKYKYSVQRIDLGTTANLWYRDIHYANGVWIMICQTSANNNIWRSVDGINWTRITYAGTISTWTGVRYANGRWVATGNQGLSRSGYSDDNGLTWISQTAGGSQRYYLDYGNGVWVTSKITGTNARFDTNLTGLNTDWVARSTPASMNKNWIFIKYGGGVFVSTADSGTDCIAYSHDGINWTQLTNLPFSGADCLPAWNGSYFLVRVGTGNVAMSSDGINWTMYVPDIRRVWFKIIWSGEFFIAVSANHVDVSYDGLKWTNIYEAPSNFFLYSIATDGDKIITCNFTGGSSPLVVLSPI